MILDNLFKPNESTTSPIRDVDLLSTLYDVVYQNWVDNHYYNLDSPRTDYRNYIFTPYFPLKDYRRRMIFKNYIQNATVKYNDHYYKFLEDGTAVEVKQAVDKIDDDYDKEIILLAEKLLERAADNIPEEDGKIKSLAKQLFPIIGKYDNPALKELAAKLLGAVDNKKPAKLDKTSYLKAWNKISELEKEYYELINNSYDGYERKFRSDCIIAKYNIKRLSLIYRLMATAESIIDKINKFEKDNGPSIILDNIKRHYEHTYKNSLEQQLFRDIISFQKYILGTSKKVDSNVENLLEDYIFHYSYILDRNLLFDEDREALENNHYKTLVRFKVEQEEQNAREAANALIESTIDGYTARLNTIVQPYVDNMMNKLTPEFIMSIASELNYLKDTVIRDYAQSILVCSPKIKKKVDILVSEINTYLKYLNISKDKLLTDEEESKLYYFMMDKILKEIMYRYCDNVREIEYIINSTYVMNEELSHKIIAKFQITDSLDPKTITSDSALLNNIRHYLPDSDNFQFLFSVVDTILNIILNAYYDKLRKEILKEDME